jgi:ethanolamine ammonia-lyase small subunit
MNDRPPKPALIQDPWAQLSRYTPARIALGRSGVSLPTSRMLEFSLAHAQARDAVHADLDVTALADQLTQQGWTAVHAHSAVSTRAEYLQRPDLGRQLDEMSRARLRTLAQPVCEVVFVLADGLSAQAVARHALPVLTRVAPELTQAGLRLGPIVLAEQARVALGDEIGELLQAQLVAVLIGERPGLSSPDSLGVYLTFGPRVGRVDAERNCISNIRPQGLDYARAAYKLSWLIRTALARRGTGVTLKDESDADLLSGQVTYALREPE